MYFISFLLKLPLILLLSSLVVSNATNEFNVQNQIKDVILEAENVNENIITVLPNVVVEFRLKNFIKVSFVVVQCHSYLHPLKFIHYNGNYNESLEGLNMGFVDTTPSQEDKFIIENNNQFPVVALFAIIPYKYNVPVPGGCNMEFPTETAPYLEVNMTGDLTTLTAAPAKEPSKENPCNGSDLYYTFYMLYSPQRDFSNATYFQSIRRMMTLENILQYAVEIPSWNDVTLRRLIASYPGTGVTFGTCVRSPNGNYATYVPIHTFGCTYNEADGKCVLKVSVSTPIKVAMVFLLTVGIVLNFYGFRCHMFRGFTFTALLSGVISYAIIYDESSSPSGFILLPYVIGILVALIVLILTYKQKWLFTFISMVTISLFMGSFFIFLGSGRYEFHWLSYIGVSLLVAVLLCSTVRQWCGVSACVVGGYLMVLPVDFLFGPSLHYIIIDIVRATAVSGFSESFIHPPFQITDVVLISLWWILVGVGVASQTYFNNRRDSETSPLLGDDDDVFAQRPTVYSRCAFMPSAPPASSTWSLFKK